MLSVPLSMIAETKVLLFASVERFSVSRMWAFLFGMDVSDGVREVSDGIKKVGTNEKRLI